MPLAWQDIREVCVDTLGELRTNQIQGQLSFYGQDENARAWERALKREWGVIPEATLGQKFEQATSRVHPMVVNAMQLHYVTLIRQGREARKWEFLSYTQARSFVKEQRAKFPPERVAWVPSDYPDHRDALRVGHYGTFLID